MSAHAGADCSTGCLAHKRSGVLQKQARQPYHCTRDQQPPAHLCAVSIVVKTSVQEAATLQSSGINLAAEAAATFGAFSGKVGVWAGQLGACVTRARVPSVHQRWRP